MQTDPIGMKDQINLYAYVGNDPTNKADPSGQCNKSTSILSYGQWFCGGEPVKVDGKPQVTNGPNGSAHARESVNLAKEQMGYKKVWGLSFNRQVRTITGDPKAPMLRADTMIIEKIGPNRFRLTPGEVVSTNQTSAGEVAKWQEWVGRSFTNAKTGATFQMGPAITRGLSNSLTGLQLLDLILGGINNPQDPGRDIWNGAGMYSPQQWQALTACPEGSEADYCT